MTIRPLYSLADMRCVEEVQRLTWGCSDRELVPSHLLLASAQHACLLGAFEDNQLIGYVYGFIGPGYLYSHLAAVRPHYRGRGFGTALKQAQADWAWERGLQRIVWLFDPLQGQNARLSIGILGATAGRYFVDHYGELDDDLNRGIPTDRLEVDWWLDARPRRPRAEPFTFPWPLNDKERLLWRKRMREQFQEHFARGLEVVEFQLDKTKAVYWFG